jgi:hypothetical protein
VKAGFPWFAGLAMFLVGAGLTASPALAKCHKDCKTQFASALKSCKAVCPKGKTGKQCRGFCKAAKKASLVACKAATNPTPPDCGEATTTTTTTTTLPCSCANNPAYPLGNWTVTSCPAAGCVSSCNYTSPTMRMCQTISETGSQPPGPGVTVIFTGVAGSYMTTDTETFSSDGWSSNGTFTDNAGNTNVPYHTQWTGSCQ